MPVMQTALVELNNLFGLQRIGELVEQRQLFEPGKSLEPSFFAEPGSPLHAAFTTYFGLLPGSIHETLRSVIHYALSTSPPTQITFAWAPAYDYEINLWQAPDTALTKGGITLLLKSRYPDDTHPLL